MVVLFGRPKKIDASGIVLSSGADGQGAVNFEYEGMNATVLYSKIANSSLPTEIQGEEGNITLDRINIIGEVKYTPRLAAASGRGPSAEAQDISVVTDKDESGIRLIDIDCYFSPKRKVTINIPEGNTASGTPSSRERSLCYVLHRPGSSLAHRLTCLFLPIFSADTGCISGS